MISVVWGALESRFGWAEHVREVVKSSFWVANRATKKVKIERVMGPRISMASAGWGCATTNRRATVLLGYR